MAGSAGLDMAAGAPSQNGKHLACVQVRPLGRQGPVLASASWGLSAPCLPAASVSPKLIFEPVKKEEDWTGAQSAG